MVKTFQALLEPIPTLVANDLPTKISKFHLQNYSLINHMHIFLKK